MQPLQDDDDDALQPFPEMYCRSAVQSSGSALQWGGHVLSIASVARAPATLLRTIAERLRHAIAEEGTTQNRVEAAVGFAVNRYATGKRGGSTVDVDKMKALADHLHVRVEWLVWGDGPMRREGRGTTPAEEAMVLARRSGVREEVWQSAWERYKERESSMTAMDWALAIHTEEELWTREAAQRAERMDATAQPSRVDSVPKTKGPTRGKTT